MILLSNFRDFGEGGLQMHGFVRGMEMGIFGALVGAANASGRRREQSQPQVRIVRQTSRKSIDDLISALRSETKRANDLRAENAELRRRLAKANNAALEAIHRRHRQSGP
ncbi:hypothetical protein VQ042_20810 [Aurantimonas sp. A2-1-M11]|uniref:hypothetical protein n=1 Tax=Aurantimonas sp. A2-1-M11 TaxID=3113712 RepID=UPI002F9460DC